MKKNTELSGYCIEKFMQGFISAIASITVGYGILAIINADYFNNFIIMIFVTALDFLIYSVVK